MADRVKKISEFPVLSSPNSSTFFVVSHTDTGVANTYTLSLATLFGNSAANVELQKVTPANSTISVNEGTVFYDDTYLYVAVANNSLKRVTLESF